jgi:hypothetical protein
MPQYRSAKRLERLELAGRVGPVRRVRQEGVRPHLADGQRAESCRPRFDCPGTQRGRQAWVPRKVRQYAVQDSCLFAYPGHTDMPSREPSSAVHPDMWRGASICAWFDGFGGCAVQLAQPLASPSLVSLA